MNTYRVFTVTKQMIRKDQTHQLVCDTSSDQWVTYCRASENLLAVICNVLIVLALLLMDNYLHWGRFPLVPLVHDLNAHLQVTWYLWVNKTAIYR